MSLTDKERQLWWAFQAYLNAANKESFSADDLDLYLNQDEFTKQREKEVFKDPTHDKGAFFFKLLQAEEIRKVGSIYGRYNRSIKLYQAI